MLKVAELLDVPGVATGCGMTGIVRGGATVAFANVGAGVGEYT